MKPSEKQKAEIRGYILKWRPKLFLHQWEFDIHYHDNPEKHGLEITMQTDYKNAIIAIHEDIWLMDKTKREEVIVHELCHCIVQPLVKIACDAGEGNNVSQREIDWHKEQVTQHLAVIISNLQSI